MTETKEALELLSATLAKIPVLQKHSKNEWLQLLFYNRKKVHHQMDGCNWTCELTQYL